MNKPLKQYLTDLMNELLRVMLTKFLIDVCQAVQQFYTDK